MVIFPGTCFFADFISFPPNFVDFFLAIYLSIHIGTRIYIISFFVYPSLGCSPRNGCTEYNRTYPFNFSRTDQMLVQIHFFNLATKVLSILDCSWPKHYFLDPFFVPAITKIKESNSSRNLFDCIWRKIISILFPPEPGGSLKNP